MDVGVLSLSGVYSIRQTEAVIDAMRLMLHAGCHDRVS
jgi:hypothetical protein